MVHTKDPLTGELFIKRRNNQKFANRQNQIKYNNNLAQRKRDAKLPFEKALDKNRTILKEILGDGKEKLISRDFLLGMGFSFGYLLYHKVINGVTYAGIYEFGIIKIEKNNYKIIKF